MNQALLISAFGLAGVWLRHGTNLLITGYLPNHFPLATLTINIIGSFLIGIIYAIGLERNLISPELRLGLMTGLLGGFTTFSTFSLDAARLFEQNFSLYALLYIGSSVMFGIAAAWAGLSVARTF